MPLQLSPRQLLYSCKPLLCLALLCSVPSCAALKRDQSTTTISATDPNQPRGWALMYPELMNQNPSTSPDGSPITADGSPSGMPSSSAPGMFDFSSMFAQGGASTGGLNWNRSASDAIEEARQKGLPLLTLITHYNSKPAQDLESTVLRSPEFHEITGGQVILLRIDYYLTEVRRSEYYQNLKQRLKAKGYPTLVLSLPDGTEILRLAGYKKEYHDSHLRQLRSSLKDLPEKITQRRATLTNQGYRLWKSKDQRDVFAKLIALDANKATFVGEWGIEFSTFTTRLSDEDQQWIEQRRQQSAQR